MQIQKETPRLAPQAGVIKSRTPQPARPVAKPTGSGSPSKAALSKEDKPRPLLSGLLQGLADNYAEAKDDAKQVAGSAKSTARSVSDKARGAVEKAKDFATSPETHVKVDGVTRTVRGVAHAVDAGRDLSSSTNRVLTPEHKQSDRHGKSPSDIKVTSWNLHHGASQDKDGARAQLQDQIAKLKEDKSDVTLLQEVLPWHAQEIVEKTGKIGYYSQTTPRQGNMILVDPALKVEANTRQTLNHKTPDLASGLKTAWAPGGKEPRAAQALRLQQPDGTGSLTVFNTHLSTGRATPADRKNEAKTFTQFVNSQVQPGQPVIGGGDLNMSRNSSMLDGIKNSGFRLFSAPIDHLASQNARPTHLEWGDQYKDRRRLSDHPMISGTYRLE